ncbi:MULTISPECIES: lipid-A-disaccharide synthase-related protein [unclassified Leptolyngbya]|uniref:lipid-A-disaccharide synthase-related protein n=1 Tax=unclassified Leptolyngbya TaxID=2650499 RepID=UPI001686C300|nr:MULTISPECIES: lipid-A-disaccharide synthase-related protein [unclassified Leptolyngbya]MBD1911600.1 hypothetical protein [Leptolyngbya sp. FACHB-8]MBD2158767.1 hypothetical protein [Leptolyngbya sp. FACHB-16]
MRLLCLSNGHGEDAIAVRVLQALQALGQKELVALPIVGEGSTYERAGIPIVGTVKAMPSGGFVYMDGRQLARDLRGGLVQLTLAQIRTVRQWAADGGHILAVGDIVPLMFAWASGASYSFIGTAKSEYYLRDESGVLTRRTWFEQMESWSGSVYLPWDRWFMAHSRCRAVFPRDHLTADTLKRWSMPVFDLGNPMMDGLDTDSPQPSWETEPITIALLPGSRHPEAYENWKLILQKIQSLVEEAEPIEFVGAIAPSLSLEPLVMALLQQGWQKTAPQTFTQKHHSLRLTQTEFADTLQRAHLAIAMAGTATEQAVGLGKPVITFPGQGPQFTPAFAEAQTRLLGSSILYLQGSTSLTETIRTLRHDKNYRHQIALNGRRRMGTPGAAARIAACLLDLL